MPVIIHTSRLLEPGRGRAARGARRAPARQVRHVALAAARGAVGRDAGGAMSVAAPSILLADDDDIGRYVIATMLRRAGFTVSEVADGLDAVVDACVDAARPRGARRQDAGARRVRGVPADQVPRRHAAHPGADAVGDVHGDRGAGRGARDRRRRVPDAAGRGAGAGGDDPLAAARAQPRDRGAARRLGVAHDVRRDQRRRRRARRRRASSLRANRAFLAAFGGDVVGTRVPALDVGRESGELELGERTHSVRVDARTAASQRLVVTLSDITAARQTERERAEALARERTISRTLQQTLLPERLPADARLALHAWHLAAEQELIVGGDWYDVIETREGVWLVIGRRRRARRRRRRAGRAAAPLPARLRARGVRARRVRAPAQRAGDRHRAHRHGDDVHPRAHARLRRGADGQRRASAAGADPARRAAAAGR